LRQFGSTAEVSGHFGSTADVSYGRKTVLPINIVANIFRLFFQRLHYCILSTI